MIPDLLLEKIRLGELKKEDFYAQYGEKELLEALKKLEEEDKAFFNKYSPSQMEFIIQNKNKLKKSVKFWNFRKITYAMTAALIICVAGPVAVNLIKSPQNVSEIRIKGIKKDSSKKEISPKGIYLYKNSAAGVIELKDGDVAKEGEKIQIAFNAGKNPYVFVFSKDGRGNITKHYPEQGTKAEKVFVLNEDVLLDYSYELDDAPYYESFILLSSKKPFTFEEKTGLEELSKEIDVNTIKIIKE